MPSEEVCPDHATLRAYCAGQVDDTRRAVIHRHLQDCRRCAEWTEHWGEGRTEHVTEAGDGLDVPHPLSPTQPSDPEPTAATEDYLSAISSLSLDAPQSATAIGRLGKYDILGILGYGGMGVVLHGYDTELRRDVAIKTLNRPLSASHVATRRFMREARAAAAINHPHVVTIYSVDQHGGMPFIVMELLRGPTLASEIKRHGRLDPIRVLRISAQIAAGLAAAHLQGVIHRDIKPGNVMLEADVDRCKITDFGLARATIDNLELTSREMAVGTPAYMSPEQVTEGEVGARSDLFSQGCVMYAMLVGHSPFHGRNAFEIVRRVAQCEPTDLRTVDPGIPEFLSEIVMRLLQKSPGDRFQSAAELGDILNRHLTMINQAKSDEQGRIPLTPPLPSTSLPAPAKRRTLAMLGLLSVVIPVCAILWTLWSRPSTTQSTSVPAVPLPTDLTVSQAGDADYTSISAALRAAQAGAVIRVLDNATYAECLTLDKNHITLSSAQRATLRASKAVPEEMPNVLEIHDCRNVIVEGFQILSGERGHAVSLYGNVEQIVLRRLSIAQVPGAVDFAAMRFSSQSVHTDPDTVRLEQCEVRAVKYPCLWLEDHTAPTTIHDCVFLPTETAVVVWGASGNLEFSGCVVRGGMTGMNVIVGNWSAAQRIHLSNNTFDGVTAWLGIHVPVPDQVELAITNNLILDGRDMEIPDTILADLARRDVFQGNFWQVPAGIPWVPERMGFVATQLTSDPADIPRDPQQPAYLKPPAASVLATDGAGGGFPTYVGAVPPAGR